MDVIASRRSFASRLFQRPLIGRLSARAALPWVLGLGGVLLSAILFLVLAVREQAATERQFEAEASRSGLAVQNALGEVVDAVSSVGSFSDSSLDVDREQFRTFTAPIISPRWSVENQEFIAPRQESLKSLLWIPAISLADRTAYEESARRDGFTDFQITELNADGEIVPAAARDVYLPLYFIEPYPSNAAAFGLDLGPYFTLPQLEPLSRARDSGELTASGRITILPDSSGEPGFAVTVPLYQPDKPVETADQRRAALRGFVIGVSSISDIVENAVEPLGISGADVALFDMSGLPEERLLYPAPPASEPDVGTTPDAFRPQESPAGLHQTSSIDIGGREWRMVITPAEGYLADHRSYTPVIVLVSGLLIALLLAASSAMLIGRTARVEALVAERGRELTAAYEKLEGHTVELKTQQVAALNIAQDADEARDRAVEAEQVLARQTRELERSNAELEQFANVASHDLQEPLRMVSSYVQLLKRRYQGQLDADADEFIGFATDGAKRMQALINDLLTFSRVTTRGDEFASTDLDAVLRRALHNLEVTINENGAVVTHDPLPTLVADSSQMGQLFQNLIGNAIKFRGELAPQIHAGAERIDGQWRFSVRDNGIGIDPAYTERIFVIFQRLHTREEYAGNGIGLSICKKIVERHGGRIWLESVPGAGSTFYFTVPDGKGIDSV